MHQYTDGVQKLRLGGRGFRDCLLGNDKKCLTIAPFEVISDQHTSLLQKRLCDVETPIAPWVEIFDGMHADPQRAATILHAHIIALDAVSLHEQLEGSPTGHTVGAA